MTTPAPPLPVGAPFPPFRLPDLTGRTLSLEDFRGRRVFLAHWNPHSDICDLIAPDLARRQTEFRQHDVQFLLASRGDAASHRRLVEDHGIACPILLQDGAGTMEAFRGWGAPLAYLLDERGHTLRPLAVGPDEVLSLAQETATGRPFRRRLPGERDLRESRLERAGLKPGTPAPAFSLPDVHGRMVSLADYRGRQVLLLFTDPHCAPCDLLYPSLVRMHRKHGDGHVVMVMVGRGDREENRRKAEQYGFEFPVVVQRRWELSKEYGFFATPAAFLIGQDGVIEEEVANGSREVLALVRRAFKAGCHRGESTRRPPRKPGRGARGNQAR